MTQALDRTRALIGLRRWEEAAAEARAGLASDPRDADLALLYAIALCEARDEEALAAAQQAVALQPDAAKAHQILGWATYGSGRYAQAADVLAHAISLDPHDAESHVMPAEALLRMTQGHRRMDHTLAAEAHAHAEEAVRLRPSAAGGYLVHAKACLAEGSAAGATAWAAEGLSVEPDNPVGHQVLGLAARQRGDLRSASDHFVDAGRLDPHSDRPIKLLRNPRAVSPAVVIVATVVGTQMVRVLNLTLGPAIAAAVVVVILLAVVLYFAYGGRRHARREMSDRAREVLDRDRNLRRRRRR
jgi:tetratricopeptide (TPR) repeat protein